MPKINILLCFILLLPFSSFSKGLQNLDKNKVIQGYGFIVAQSRETMTVQFKSEEYIVRKVAFLLKNNLSPNAGKVLRPYKMRIGDVLSYKTKINNWAR